MSLIRHSLVRRWGLWVGLALGCAATMRGGSPVVQLTSPSPQTITRGTSLTLSTVADDEDGDMGYHNIDVQRPDGSWNFESWGGPAELQGIEGNGWHSAKSHSFVFDQVGTWHVRAAAFDGSPWVHSTEEGVAITVVAPPNHPPYGWFDSATSSLSANQTLTGSGWAIDEDTGSPVASVQIKIDGGYRGLASPINGYRPDVASAMGNVNYTYSGWSFSLNVGALSPGTHTVEAVAVDPQGATASCGSKTFTIVQSPPRTDSMSVSPTSVRVGNSITLTGAASDPDGNLSRMDFYVYGADIPPWLYVGTANLSGGSATGIISWVPTKRGSYIAHIRAFDGSGTVDYNGSITTGFTVTELQPSVTSVDATRSVGQSFTPAYNGGAGNGAWQFVVVDQTNWPGTSGLATGQTGTLVGSSASASWTPPGAGTYYFYIRRIGTDGYEDAMSYNYATASTPIPNSNLTGYYTLTVTAPPVIVTQPASQTVTVDSPASFSVAASGYPDPTYQWRKNGTAIPGATQASYTIAKAQAADEGSYTVLVSNAGGAVLSNPATLTIGLTGTRPTIVLKSPGAITVNVGTRITIASSATDAEADMLAHHQDVRRPLPGQDGTLEDNSEWNHSPSCAPWPEAHGTAFEGGPTPNSSSSNKSAAVTFDRAGTWQVYAAANDSTTAAGVKVTPTSTITVVTSGAPVASAPVYSIHETAYGLGTTLTEDHSAEEIWSGTSNVRVQPGGDVTYRAGYRVRLVAGFSAARESHFRAMIGNGYTPPTNGGGSGSGTGSGGSGGARNDGTLGLTDWVFPETDGTADASPPSGWPNGASTRTEVVGFTPLDFSVNANGEATARIPITVTPGVAGLQPALTLAYNHNGPNGFLGLGWSIQGLSIVTRRNGNLATDGTVSPINLDANDKFALDGQKLIAIGTDSATGATEYRTEIDGFSRILAYSPSSGPNYGPSRFEVYTKSGLKLDFGDTGDVTTDSRIMAGSPAPAEAVMAWPVNTITDRNGNKIHFYYTKNTAIGEFYISKITYLGSEKAQIVFTPEATDRPDISSGYSGGAPWVRTKRLERIEVKHDAALMRRYDLTYEISPNTGRSRLKYVQEFDATGNALPKLTLDYKTYKTEDTGWKTVSEPAFEPPQPLAINRISSDFTTGMTGAGFVDLDGDGLPELLHRHWGSDSQTQDGYVAKGTTDGWVVGAGFSSKFFPRRYLGYDAQYTDLGVRFCDLNGDGYPDMIAARDYDALAEPRSAVFLNTASGWTQTSGWTEGSLNIGGNNSDPDRGVRFVDLDGDGRVDAIWSRFESHAGTVRGALRNTGTGWTPFPAGYAYAPPDGMWLSPSYGASYSFESGVRLIDINGDGLVDILCNWANVSPPKAYLNTGKGWREEPLYAPKEPIARGGVPTQGPSGSDFVDVNGDGLPDQVTYIGNESPSRVVTWLNTGKGWVLGDTRFNLPAGLVNRTYSSDNPTSVRYGTVFADVNGDGRADMISATKPSQNSSTPPPTAVYLNTGNGWSRSTEYVPKVAIAAIKGGLFGDAQANDMGTQILDIDGDGLPDIVTHQFCPDAPDNEKTYKYAYRNRMGMPDLLEKIEHSSGETTTITYSTLARNEDGFYTRGSRAAASGYPITDIQDSRYVVRNVASSDGIGGYYNLKYGYTALRSHALEGFLGFEVVKVTDDRTSKSVATYYRQDFPYIGIPWKLETATANGRVVNSTTMTLSAQSTVPDKPRVSAPYTRIVEERSFDPDSSNDIPFLARTTTIDDISLWGDPLDKTVEASDGYATVTTNKIAYASAADVYPGQPEEITTTVTASTQAPLTTSSKTRVSRLHFDARGRVDVETSEPLATANPTPQQNDAYLASDFAKRYYLTKTLHYDSYGNTDSVELAGAPGTFATRRTTLEYSSLYEGRFLTLQMNPEGHSETFSEYDEAFGVAKKHTDANQLPTTYEFDGLGRITKETRPGNLTTTINRRWAATGQGPVNALYHVETLSQGQPPTLVFFDTLARPVRTVGVSPDNRLTFSDTYYDSRGNISVRTRPYFSGADAYGTLTELDALGRISKITFEGRLAVDGDGHVTSVTSAIGASTFTYSDFTTTETRPGVNYAPAVGIAHTRTATIATTRNSLGTVAKVVESGTTTETNRTDESLSATISYAYDGFGALTTIVDPINATTSYSVDAYGRRTQAADPNRGTWMFTYNALGELTAQIDANQASTTFGYDRLGRTTTRSIGGLSTTWTYDTEPGKGVGQIASITSFGDVNEAFEYDSYGRLSKSTRSLGAGSNKVDYARFYGYDDFHRLKTVAHGASGFTERRIYSSNGHWVALRNDATSGRYWVGTAYEADGRVKTILYGNGLITQRTYRPDRGGVLDSVQTGSATAPQSAQDLQYFYEPGRVGSVYQRLDFNHHVGEGFTYDALNRLRRTYFGSVSGRTTAIGNSSASDYKYDSAGNLTFKTDVGSYNYFPAAEQGTAHGAHAIKSIGSGPVFTYDNNGNLKTAGDITTLWTSFNQPASISRAGALSSSFSYDADLQRVRQVHGSETIDYAGAGHEHRVVAGGANDHVHYLMGPFGRMGQVTWRNAAFSSVRYFHHDHLGSVDTITGLDGTAEPQSYDPWGERRSGATWQAGFVSSNERRGFTDHEELDDLKLINMNGRIYDPKIGRFLSVDPVYDRLYQTQGVNAYSYVRNNPISYTDPTGLQTAPDSSWFGSTVQMDRFVVNGTNTWDYTRQFGAPGLRSTSSTGVASAWDPTTNATTLGQSFRNGALTVYSPALTPVGSTDPGTPEDNPEAHFWGHLQALGDMAEYWEQEKGHSWWDTFMGRNPYANEGHDLILGSRQYANTVLTGNIAMGLLTGPATVTETLLMRSGSFLTSQAKGIQFFKLMGDQSADAIAARYTFALREVPFQTVGGTRIHDVVPLATGRNIAIESKVGEVFLRGRIRQEVARDWWLLRQKQLDQITWEFTRSPVTGKVGPDPKLLQSLQRLGIQTKVNP